MISPLSGIDNKLDNYQVPWGFQPYILKVATSKWKWLKWTMGRLPSQQVMDFGRTTWRLSVTVTHAPHSRKIVCFIFPT